MDDVNPYQSPEAEPGKQLPGVGVWRKGKLLVVHKSVRLPDVCLKTGQAADRRIPLELKWETLTRHCHYTIEAPVCDAWWQAHQRRNRRIIGIAAAAIGCLLLFAYGISAQWPVPLLVCLLAAFAAAFLGMMIYNTIATFSGGSLPFVEPAKVEEHHAHLKNVHADVLAGYPDWE